MTRVLVVDDSALVRRALAAALDAEADLEVVAHAVDPYEARRAIVEHEPDVVVLDLELPRMDGLAFLRRLMQAHPMPVVVYSAFTADNGALVLEALALGAVEVVHKPDERDAFAASLVQLVGAVRRAARARVRRVEPSRRLMRVREASQGDDPRRAVIALGASTGGPAALAHVLEALPTDVPPVVVAQHMPGMFTRLFAEHLDGVCRLSVHEARDGEDLERGHVYVAPGDAHLRVTCRGDGLVGRVAFDEPVGHCRPSVDVLFESVAHASGASAVAVLMTGMGRDGAAGLAAVRRAGGVTIAQDEATSVVWGMPAAAVEAGAVERIVPLRAIAAEILAALSPRVAGRTSP